MSGRLVVLDILQSTLGSIEVPKFNENLQLFKLTYVGRLKELEARTRTGASLGRLQPMLMTTLNMGLVTRYYSSRKILNQTVFSRFQKINVEVQYLL